MKKFNKFNESKIMKAPKLSLDNSNSIKWIEDIISLIEDLEISGLEFYRSFSILNIDFVEYTVVDSDSMDDIDGVICGDKDFDLI